MSSHTLSLRSILTLIAVILLTAANGRAQTTDNKAKPTGSIAGRVTLKERGLPDIVVAAQSTDRSGPLAVSRAKTDASGRYRLTGLSAGQYQVSTIAPAMTIAEQPGMQNSYFRGPTVVLSAGEEVDDVDIELARGGVITGRVIDADGKPVVQERVNLQIVDQGGNRNRQPDFFMWNYQMNQTDDRGIYRIYGLPAARYRVSVGSEDSGYVSSNNHVYYPRTFYGDTNDPAKASIVELQEGSEATNIDIRVGRAANTFVATGRVVDAETGQPIQGIRLTHGPANPNQPFYGGMIGMPTGPRGEFRLEGLEPGHYGVSVSASLDASTFYSDPLLFDITDADVTNLELKATRGLTLSGVVVFEGARAKELRQQAGTLRVFADVSLASNSQSRTMSSSSIAADGSFNVTGVRPGKARLYVGSVSNAAWRGISTQRVERNGVDVTQNLDIQPGEFISDLRIVAALGTGTIRGTVRFVGGSPPPNIRVGVGARREGSFSGSGGMVDARGRFVINNLINGTYEVSLAIGYYGASGARQPRPQRQMVIVSEDAETQVDFVVDLSAKDGP